MQKTKCNLWKNSIRMTAQCPAHRVVQLYSIGHTTPTKTAPKPMAVLAGNTTKAATEAVVVTVNSTLLAVAGNAEAAKALVNQAKATPTLTEAAGEIKKLVDVTTPKPKMATTAPRPNLGVPDGRSNPN